jgi:hypothetical protein
MQRPTVRPATSATPAPQVVARPSTLTSEEEARAAELEAAIVAEERAAESSRRPRPQRAVAEVIPRSHSTLAVSAKDEYAYVGRDVRRIVKVGGTLLAVLAALWVVVQITGVTL